MKKVYDTVVVGDVFWDVIIETRAFDRLSFQGGTFYFDNYGFFPGGAGNIAVGLSKLGGKAAFIGKIGNDILGQLYVQDLQHNGVFNHIIIDRENATGIIIDFIEEDERTFMVYRGANDKLFPDDISESGELINKSRYLYVSGYSLVNAPQRDAIFNAVKLAKELNVKVFFDPGAYNLIDSRKPYFTNILKFCDVFCLNLKEAKVLTGQEKTCNIIQNLKGVTPLVVLKLGAKGSIALFGEKCIESDGFNVICVDSTGAGDAFSSALLYGLCRGFHLEKISRFANWFAAQVIKRTGARSYPSRPKILRFINLLLH